MHVSDEMRRELREIILKHGAHDQSSHGNWATGRGGGSSDSGQGGGGSSPRSSNLVSPWSEKRVQREKRELDRKRMDEQFFRQHHKEMRDRIQSMTDTERQRLRQALIEENRFVEGGRKKGKPLTEVQRIGKRDTFRIS